VGRRLAGRLIALVGGFALATLPLLLDNGPGLLGTLLHNTPEDLGKNTYAVLLPQNTARALYEFFVRTSLDHVVVGALFTPIAGAALAIGVALALRHGRELASRVLLIWFAVTVLLTTPFNDATAVSVTRSLIMIPVASLLAALALCSVAGALQQVVSRRMWGMVSRLCMLAALAGSGALSAYRFYVTLPRTIGVSQLSMAIDVLRTHPYTTVVLSGNDADGGICIMLDGYRLATVLVLRLQAGQISQLCTEPASGAIPPWSELLLLTSNPANPDGLSCRSHPIRLLASANGRDAEYGLHAMIPPGPANTYADRVLERIHTFCRPAPPPDPGGSGGANL